MRAAQHLQTLLSVSDYQSCSDFSLSLFDDELELLIEDSEIQASEKWTEKKSLDALSNMAEMLEGESDYYKVDPEFVGADLSKENRPVVIVENKEDMTLRQHYAGLAIQGLLSGPDHRYGPDEAAREALTYADSMIYILEKNKAVY